MPNGLSTNEVSRAPHGQLKNLPSGGSTESQGHRRRPWGLSGPLRELRTFADRRVLGDSAPRGCIWRLRPHPGGIRSWLTDRYTGVASSGSAHAGRRQHSGNLAGSCSSPDHPGCPLTDVGREPLLHAEGSSSSAFGEEIQCLRSALTQRSDRTVTESSRNGNSDGQYANPT